LIRKLHIVLWNAISIRLSAIQGCTPPRPAHASAAQEAALCPRLRPAGPGAAL